jgi:hypothetical protein
MAEPKKDEATPTFSDISQFMQKMWNPFGVPLPGFGMPVAPMEAPGAGAAASVPGMAGGMPFPNPAAMFATLDPAELGRKIDELRIVEGWLQMSLHLMQLSIKTMELQKASLEALRGSQQASPEKPPSAGRKS